MASSSPDAFLSLSPLVEDEHGVMTNLSTNDGGGSRQNKGKKYEEGIQYITPQLRDIASRANAVDEALHRFVSAKFCTRLREVGLLNHPLVEEELQRYSKLNDRLKRPLAFNVVDMIKHESGRFFEYLKKQPTHVDT